MALDIQLGNGIEGKLLKCSCFRGTHKVNEPPKCLEIASALTEGHSFNKPVVTYVLHSLSKKQAAEINGLAVWSIYDSHRGS